MSLTRTEIDEMKTQIEKTVDKFLGYGEPSVVTMAVNCIVSGYDKRKTTGDFLYQQILFCFSYWFFVLSHLVIFITKTKFTKLFVFVLDNLFSL